MDLPKPKVFVKSSEWNDALLKRCSFNGWRHDYGDCDMRLYTEEQLHEFAKSQIEEVLGLVFTNLVNITKTKELAKDMDQTWCAAAQGMHRLANEALKKVDHFKPDEKASPEKFEEALEEAYWVFDAKRKGYSMWHDPMSERDAFKTTIRKLLKDANDNKNS